MNLIKRLFFSKYAIVAHIPLSSFYIIGVVYGNFCAMAIPPLLLVCAGILDIAYRGD